MAGYVDGFVVPIPRRKVAEYKKIASNAAKVWRELGALEYRECIADDVSRKGPVTYARAVKLKKGEVVYFSWIVYKSRRQRDAVIKKVMKDKRILAMMEKTSEAFDMKRMLYGGFRIVVDK
jgi:uncharacterized protein YbaA (DUF1428 family)